MDQRTLGRTHRTVSAIGLGTWQLGADWGEVSEEQALDVLAAAVDAGVTLLDTDLDKLRMSFWRYNNQVHGLASSKLAIEQHVKTADMVIGAVLVKGARAPHLVTRDMLSRMRPGSVIVDVAVDQGGCFETTKPTTHTNPTFTVDGIVHYCVANMPGAVPRTSTQALSNATLPFALSLADRGVNAALEADPHLLNGLNVCAGDVTDHAVAETFDLEHVDPLVALARR